MLPRSARAARTARPLHAGARALLAGLLSVSLLGAGAITAQADDDVPPVADAVAPADEQEPAQDPAAPEDITVEVVPDAQGQAEEAAAAQGEDEADGSRGDDEAATDAPASDAARSDSQDTARATSSWQLSQRADPASGTEVEPGTRITYTLQAEALSTRPATGIAASVDLSEVLAHAEVVQPLARDLSLSGNQLTWNQRQPVRQGQPATISFVVVVDADAAGARLTSVAAPTGEGGTCAQCTLTHTVPGDPSWDLNITANHDPGTTLLTNAPIVSTMTAQNTSDVTVSGAEVVADLSGMGEHWDLGILRDGVSFDAGSALLTWDVPELEPGESATQRFQVRLRAPARGSDVALSFAAEGAGGECVGGCEPAYHVSGFDATASAAPGTGEVLPGDEITYTWQVQNISGGELTGAYLRANLGHQNGAVLDSAELLPPLSEQFETFGSVLHWNIPDLAPGEDAEVTFSVAVTEEAIAGADLWMQITPGSPRHGGSALTDPIVHTVGEPTWELSQHAEPGSGTTVQPGQEIIYTIGAEALALRPVTGVSASIDLSQVLDNATLVEPLAPGLSASGSELTWNVRHPVHRNTPASVSFSVITTADSDGATLTSVATPQRTGGTCTDCTVTHTVGEPAWELEVASNHEPGATLLTNAAVVPQMTVANTSGVPVSGAQVVVELSGMGDERYDVSRVPADAVYDEQTNLLTWSVADLEPGESVTELFQVRLSPTSRGAGVSMGFAAVGVGGECVSGCELAYHVSGFDASASADVAAGALAPGTEVTYTWQVQNISGGELTGAHLRSNLNHQNGSVLESAELVEPLDAGLRMIGSVLNWDIPDLGPGEEAQISFSVVVREDATDGADLRMDISTGTARHGGSVLSEPVVHTVGVPAWEVSARAAQANGVTIPDGGTVRPNGQLNYHLTAQNTSGVPIAEATVVADVSGLMPYANIEALGAGAELDAEAGVVTWSVPQLAPGEESAVSFRANLAFADAPGAVLPLAVSTQGAGGLCVSGCELEHYATGIQASLSADPAGAIAPGEQITYTWELQNISQAQVSGAYVRAQMRDVLAHAELVEPLPEGVDFAIGTTLNWWVPDLGPQESAQVTFAVVVDADAPAGAELGKQITAGANSFGVSYGERTLSHTVAVPAWEVSARAADVRGNTIPDGAWLQPNGQLNYHLSAVNTSGVSARDAAVIADVSGLMPYANIEALGAGAVFDENAGTVTWSVPDLAAGAEATVSFRANLRFADAPSAVLPLSVSTQGAGGQCVSGCDLVHYATGFEASVLAEPAQDEVRPGGEITYVWRVQNTSQAHVSGAFVRAQMSGILDHARIVELPDGVDFAIGTTLNWNVPDLAPGQQAQVSFTVVVAEDTEPGTELGMSITAGPGGLGVSYDAQSVSHTVAVSVTPPPSLPPVLAVLLGLAKFVFGLLIWLF